MEILVGAALLALVVYAYKHHVTVASVKAELVAFELALKTRLANVTVSGVEAQAKAELNYVVAQAEALLVKLKAKL